jgi:hypothetical protein
MSQAEISLQEKMQRSFVFPRLMNLMGLANWPAPVPTIAMVNEFIPDICKVPYYYLFRDDATAMAECSLLVWEYTNLDSIAGNLDIYNFESESIGAELNL